jgi:hypothetical protein
MKCKLCGKANHTHSKNTAHSWVVSQQCGPCHYLGRRTPYSNLKNYHEKRLRQVLNKRKVSKRQCQKIQQK